MWCIVPAAGIGSRFMSETPKQYVKIFADITILEQTLKTLCQYNKFTGVLVVLNKNDTFWPNIKISNNEKIHSCIGGENRSDSVFNGLMYLSNLHSVKKDEWVMVHDAARPGISLHLIDKLYQDVISTKSCGGILACPVSDTIKQVDNNRINKTIDRNSLWSAQTPQLFKLNQLLESLEFSQKKGLQITDESSAIESNGLSPITVRGDVMNFKITTKEDLTLMKAILFKK